MKRFGEPDLSWTEHAACIGFWEIFSATFYENQWRTRDAHRKGRSSKERSHARAVAAAKQICEGCPVRVECLAWALERPEHHGVWGMTTAVERWRIRHAKIEVYEPERVG